MASSDRQHTNHRRMVATIAAHMRQTADLTGEEELQPRIEQALLDTPRHAFVPPELQDSACDDCPLPIGHGQTISQPFIVALMTQLLNPQPGQKVLEVGCGCGYQLAILAELAGEAYGIERVPELARLAAQRLADMGYTNVHVRAGNGCRGWPEAAPFDGIMVTAGGEIPQDLLDQLRPGGRLVIPVRELGFAQQLRVVEKDSDGRLHHRDRLPVQFVPLIDRE